MGKKGQATKRLLKILGIGVLLIEYTKQAHLYEREFIEEQFREIEDDMFVANFKMETVSSSIQRPGRSSRTDDYRRVESNRNAIIAGN